MTIEEARKVKPGDKVKIINHFRTELNGQIGYIPFVDRIYDEEPHAVVLPSTLQGCYHDFKIECLELTE